MNGSPRTRAYRVLGEDTSPALAVLLVAGGALVAAAATWAAFEDETMPAHAHPPTAAATGAAQATATSMVAAIAAPAPQPDARATGDCPAPVVLRFELASAALNLAAARGDLAPLADWLAKHPESRVVVQGHADARGGDQDNLALSFRRATVVAGLLQELGVPSRRALVQAAGDHEPVEGLAPLADENRRVVVAPRDAAGCPRSR